MFLLRNSPRARDRCNARSLLLLPKTQTCSPIWVQRHLSVSELKDREKPPPTTTTNISKPKKQIFVLHLILGQEMKNCTRLSVMQQVTCIRVSGLGSFKTSSQFQFCKYTIWMCWRCWRRLVFEFPVGEVGDPVFIQLLGVWFAGATIVRSRF